MPADRFSVSLAISLRASLYEFEVLVKDQPLQVNSLFIANAIAGVSAAEWRKYGTISAAEDMLVPVADICLQATLSAALSSKTPLPLATPAPAWTVSLSS